MVCNSVGCANATTADNTTTTETTTTTTTTTLEAAPEGLAMPQLRNLSSTSVAVSWAEPAQPNGNVTDYVLRRGEVNNNNNNNNNGTDMTAAMGMVVFQGVAFSFVDSNLTANTLYFYTVEAINGGGSFVSSLTFHRTVPDLAEGIPRPLAEVRGRTEIVLTWFPPALPNGEISAYVVYQDNVPVLNTTSEPLSYRAINLTPFTLYSFFVEVCNQAGCASSVAVGNRTEQAPPTGVTPPRLVVLGSTSIAVSWNTPTSPNGVITEYQIRRRILGNPFTENIQEVVQNTGQGSTFSFTNFDLTPFTSYEYRLGVTNGAGQVFSEWVLARTNAAIATGVGLPMFGADNVFARNVTATWLPPTTPNGPILRYLLEYRLAIDPATLEEGPVLVAVAMGPDVTTATVTGLIPTTEYEFRVVVVNSAGRGEGPYGIVTTREDIPDSVGPIVVEERTGSSLRLSWSAPLVPNGVVTLYMVQLDGNTVFSGPGLSSVVTGLQPFTSYSLLLSACTSAGCRQGTPQVTSTAEVAPEGQGAPTLDVVVVVIVDDSVAQPGSGVVMVVVEVSWDPPSRPNGIITRYDVLRRDDNNNNNNNNSTTTSIFSTDDITNRTFSDSTVRPAQSYSYSIRAVNSGGASVGNASSVTTPEAPPEGVPAPVATPLNATAIQVSWLPPATPNGVVVSYSVFRSDESSPVYSSSAEGDDVSVVRSFTNGGLLPDTDYTYSIEACTVGGCSRGPPSVATTEEATPTDLRPPTLSARSATSISIVWEEPGMPNGDIVRYELVVRPVQISILVRDPNERSRNISNLLPFTEYDVVLEACNSVGCASAIGSVTTGEATPQFASPPQATPINATALRVEWAEPAIPNGVITLYELRRNGTLVSSGPNRTFVDVRLSPDRFYSYTVRPFTAVGPGEESGPSGAVATPRDTPEGVAPPRLRPTGSSTVSAMWAEPATPNGAIQRYVLFLDETVVFDGLAFQTQVGGLRPFTSYGFLLMVCTTTCANSTRVSVTTLEAPPTGQAPPRLSTSSVNFSVNVTWDPPQTPNGDITRYEVERRRGQTSSEFAVIYSDSRLSHVDADSALRPALTYQYRVRAVNSAGNDTSGVAEVTLDHAPPEGVPSPTISNDSVTSTSLVVPVGVPAVANGDITEYRLIQDGMQVQSGTPPLNQFVVTGLTPFTEYNFTIEACTRGGCNTSDTVFQTTTEAPPTGLSPPMGVAPSSRVINVSWRPPSQPNGIILSYTLWYRRVCPQLPQPHLQDTPTCEMGPLEAVSVGGQGTQRQIQGAGANDPLPYTAYDFFVSATNSRGSINSSFTQFTINTPPSSPEIIGSLSLRTDFANELIVLDWSTAFRFNDIVLHFDLRRNGILLARNAMTSIQLPQQPTGINLTYAVTAVTQSGSVSVSLTTRIDGFPTPPTSADTAPPTSTTSPPVSTEQETPIQNEPAFIVGMVVLGALLLFLFFTILLCCVRPSKLKLDGGGKKGLDLSQGFNLEQSLTNKQYSKLSSSPQRGHTTGTWSPGDYTKGEIPDIDDSTTDILPAISPSPAKSYSPSKMESLRMADAEKNRLSDIVISAKDDFGSFKRHQQQTTFEDTRV